MSITIKDDDTRLYAFTYRRSFKKGYIGEPKDFNPVLEHLKRQHIDIVELQYEVSEKQPHLHIHGIFRALPKQIYPSSLLVIGYQYKVEELYNRTGWEKYIRKTKQKQTLKPEIKPVKLFKFTHSCPPSDDDIEDDEDIPVPKYNLFKKHNKTI